MKLVEDFISKVVAARRAGIAVEHSYRSAIEGLFNGLADDITALHTPQRVANGAPDFIIRRNAHVVGHVKANDFAFDLRRMSDADKKQHERYRKALPNLLYTNCLDWDFYRNGELAASVRIADCLTHIEPRPQAFSELTSLLREFVAQQPQTITSPPRLADAMAAKAQVIKDVLPGVLQADETPSTALSAHYDAFRDCLIHDITREDFADIYAEVIACGMFAARLHHTLPEPFSRRDVLALLSSSNPHLRQLFTWLAACNLDDRIAWIIDDLAAALQATDIGKITADLSRHASQSDPFIQFYETFLAAYNADKRRERGVWYTPEPVVSYIVRAVDEVLQSEFGLAEGLADTSKVTIDRDTVRIDGQGTPVRKSNDTHRVQILDPATGTGAFLAEVIRQIAPKVKDVAPDNWSGYIEAELIPRLHGCEILTASYAMCHMKLDMMLAGLGYKPGMTRPPLSVHLTSSIDQALPFAPWLCEEAKQARHETLDAPILCVIGNPPYLGESGKSDAWLSALIDDYKKEPGGKSKLKERNPKWLNDLYVRFIRLSSHLIEKNGEGVLGFVTNNGYLDNPTFRGMRWHLLKTFDKIWILDLHGSAKKKEIAPDGKSDKNVFDIRQGVAIIVAVKRRGGHEQRAEIMHGKLWGERASKFQALNEATSVNSLSSTKLEPHSRYQMFYPIDQAILDTYDKGFSVADFFVKQQIGLTTSRDHLAIDFSVEEMESKLARFVDPNQSDDAIRRAFFHGKKPVDDRPGGDTASWSLATSRQDLAKVEWRKLIRPIDYRPFDRRFVCYSHVLLERPREEIIPQLFHEDNFALSFNRKIDEDRPFTDCFVFRHAIQLHSLSIKESNYFAPLYIYPDESDPAFRRINFDEKLYERLQAMSRHDRFGIADELAAFDYIYGVLHSPSYRASYGEFLRIDFPRIPWPENAGRFWAVSESGKALRKLHLMESAVAGFACAPLIGEGNRKVDVPRFQHGKIWINDTQYFDRCSEVTWNLFIGGYQPAQKWLKDRKGRLLSIDDVEHYQQILRVLSETDRIMKGLSLRPE
ncbi:type ISP restriction/modification enzyme [Paraburkholderia sp. C35]|uniref:type ISP restriction/modification enzyme n=1 Tax=Paraburkholderia sp. C35 TaxID=2126993 RepID=UPI000D694A21|nr:type ISP restriction/modification enzyme [Paraburkholderia sp. C35]